MESFPLKGWNLEINFEVFVQGWFDISGFLLILAEVHPFVEQQLMGGMGRSGQENKPGVGGGDME